MVFVQMITVSAILLVLAILGMAITMLVKKNGKFPETHIGHNRDMRKRKIVCAKTWDRQEQQKALDSLRKKHETLLSDFAEPEELSKPSYKGLHLAD